MPEQKPKPESSRLLNVIGWVLGALSVINLLKEFTPLKLAGALGEWIVAYSAFVSSIVSTLFGWIHWRWMSISTLDGHLLVLAFVFCSAVARASSEVMQDNGDPRVAAYTGAWSASLLVLFMPVLFLLALVPTPIDIVLATTCFLLLAFYFGIMFKEQDKNVPPAAIVRREVKGVLAVVVLLVVLNYSFLGVAPIGTQAGSSMPPTEA